MATIVVPNPNPAATQFETSITNTSPDWKTPAEKGESLSILGPTIHHVHVTYKIVTKQFKMIFIIKPFLALI